MTWFWSLLARPCAAHSGVCAFDINYPKQYQLLRLLQTELLHDSKDVFFQSVNVCKFHEKNEWQLFTIYRTVSVVVQPVVCCTSVPFIISWCTPWAKNCATLFWIKTHVSWQRFTLLVPVETRMTTLQRSYKIYSFTITVSPHYLVENCIKQHIVVTIFYYSTVGNKAFRGTCNFEPSHEICPFLWICFVFFVWNFAAFSTNQW